MKRLVPVVLGVVVVLGALVGISAKPVAWAQAAEAPAAAKQVRKTDSQIKREIIELSVASYSGSCPCPYNRDRAGRSCGKRSAYSRPGGAAPLCYEGDVTAAMVAAYRATEAKTPEKPLPGQSSTWGKR
jgi:hypothetical protein